MTTAYKRVDLQGAWSDRYYESKEDMRQCLIDLHENDCTDEDEEFLKKMTLDELLEYGMWECVEVEGEWNHDGDELEEDFIETNK